VVFSVREAKGIYEKAVANAWSDIEAQLAHFAPAKSAWRFQLVEVQYDPMTGESVIEELPDEPKSSRPQTVEVRVMLRAVYVLR
jgi:hypothetical protein